MPCVAASTEDVPAIVHAGARAEIWTYSVRICHNGILALSSRQLPLLLHAQPPFFRLQYDFSAAGQRCNIEQQHQAGQGKLMILRDIFIKPNNNESVLSNVHKQE
jgi:hypothetical protein